MASHIIPLFFAFSLLLVATSGRELRNTNTRDATFTAKTKQLSHASPSYIGKTNYNDEQALVAIYSKYTLMLDFNTTGDPCLPTPLAWIKCNSDANPRVIALNLNNRRLSGEIPDFRSMDALQKIDLSENRFTGNIPSFLGSFPHLEYLNLSFILFNGSVPNSLAINKKVKISYSKYGSNISKEPSNFHSVSKQVVSLANGPVADAPSDGITTADGPVADAPSDGIITAGGPVADAPNDGPTANEPTSDNISETPPAPPPADDESPPSDVPAIAGGTAGSIVGLSSIVGILYWIFGFCGGSCKKPYDSLIKICSGHKDDTVSKGDSNSNAQPGGSPAGIVSPIK